LEFFTGTDNIINQTFAAYNLVLCLAFPAYSYYTIRTNFNHLDDRKVREKHGILYEEVRTNTMANA